MTANPSNKSNRLTIPDKNKSAHPANLEALERWANNQVVNQIVAGTNVTITTQSLSNSPGSIGTGIVTINASGGGGGGYASLTGAGESSTPGDLTQAGGFTVNDTVGDGITLSSAGPVELETTGSDPLTLNANNNLDLEAGGSATLEGFVVEIESTGGSITIDSVLNISLGATSGAIQINPSELGFFTNGPHAQETVTGSRGGNAALASLLTALANYGLIIDSTSP